MLAWPENFNLFNEEFNFFNVNVNELIQMDLIQSYIGDIKFLLLSMCMCLPTNWEKKIQQINAQHKMWIKHGSLAHAFRFLSVWRIVQPKNCYFVDIFSFSQVDKSKPLKVKLFNRTTYVYVDKTPQSNEYKLNAFSLEIIHLLKLDLSMAMIV